MKHRKLPAKPPNPSLRKHAPKVTGQDLRNASALLRHVNDQATYRTGQPFTPSSGFAGCLRRWKLDWATMDTKQQEAALARYLRLTSVMNADVFAPKALYDNLAVHGLETSVRDPAAGLARQSAANLARLQPSPPATKTDEYRRAETAVERLKLAFVHNTGVLSEKPGGPVLSSHWLEVLGLGGGANTYPWNRDFLKTDNHVFFLPVLAHPETTTAKLAELRSPYGKNLVVLRDDFVKQTGFVSIFQMSANDFYRFAEVVSQARPELRPHFELLHREREAWRERNPGNGHDTLWGNEAFAKHPKELEALRHALHLFDFTVKDFEQLWRSLMLSSLERLRVADPPRFQDVVRQLETPNLELKELFKELVLAPLGLLGVGFEYKSAVAVPPEALDVYRPEDEPNRRLD